MESTFWLLFIVCCAFKLLLIPAPHSTDFEVHRNWLALTYSLPLEEWYKDTTSSWTLDYPPFFAYFEWLLAQIAQFVDPKMLQLSNLNYNSHATKYFQRITVLVMDLVFAWGVYRLNKRFSAINPKKNMPFAVLLLLANVGLIFVDNIHFQYNNLLFGILLLSISYLLEERYLISACLFAILLNFKHIFLYMAPVFAVYLLKFYVLAEKGNMLSKLSKLLVVGLLPFFISFGPFYAVLPDVISRLFPFKRGLTHAYWAPNFWALYNSVDVLGSAYFGMPKKEQASITSGLVQEVEHTLLPQITPNITFILTMIFLLPILIKLLWFTNKKVAKITFLRALVVCAAVVYMFGWHVHEKAILMLIIPLCLLCYIDAQDAKYGFFLSFIGHYSLIPLLFNPELLVLRYAMFLTYMTAMFIIIEGLHTNLPKFYWFEKMYLLGFVLLPFYEHILGPFLGFDEKYPFLTLLSTSLYCSLGILYFFVLYYIHTLDIWNELNLLNVKFDNKHPKIFVDKAQATKKLQ